MTKCERYAAEFAARDEEIKINRIDNAHAGKWMEEQIPKLTCPDPDFERTYYFRWWTYRKHIKDTPEGTIISEFLPDVPWAGIYNSINAAAGHHISEGRWLKDGAELLNPYIRFFFNHSADGHKYSSWLLTSALDLDKVTGKLLFDRSFYEDAKKYFREWDSHRLPSGLYWTVDGRDAMEFSVSGTPDHLNETRGIRPLLNAYMVSDARALATMADRLGLSEEAAEWRKEAEHLNTLLNDKLWKDGFYRAFHTYTDVNAENENEVLAHPAFSPREEIGYVPFAFGVEEDGFESAFDQLTAPDGFNGPIGISTLERRDPAFLYEADHECLWNGYVWPFATSQTLSALISVMHRKPQTISELSPVFLEHMMKYAASHIRTTEDGTVLPWIDEVLSPDRQEWTSRTILEKQGWAIYERGKDYNHSTFCDLVITGIFGVDPNAETLTLKPIIPPTWDSCRLDDLWFRGKKYSLIYSKENGMKVEITG